MCNIVKKIILASFVSTGIVSSALAGGIQLQLDKYQPRLKIPKPALQAALNPNCPNPRVREVKAEILSRSASTARVRITAVVENAGGATYQSNPRQQTITLARDSRRVSTQGFTVIRPGNRFFVTYEENVSVHGYGEFSPTFHAYLSYDPDIRIDGNPSNDDCRMNDNRKSLSGNVVNALLR